MTNHQSKEEEQFKRKKKKKRKKKGTNCKTYFTSLGTGSKRFMLSLGKSSTALSIDSVEFKRKLHQILPLQHHSRLSEQLGSDWHWGACV
jgi:hypothetical protein